MITNKALLRSILSSGLLVFVLTLSVACANTSPGQTESGYGTAPGSPSSPTVSSTTTAPLTKAGTLAQDHWSAIAKGDLTQVMSQYSESPSLQWIGGPLAGEYQGKEKIQGVWQKFIKTQAPLKTTIAQVKSTSGEQGAETITALITFSNAKTQIPVDYTLVYKPISGSDQITKETWKIVKP
ncbi:MAG: hypothetical protein C4288_20830 [Leptolyngbya sp. ERB_1_1]